MHSIRIMGANGDTELTYGPGGALSDEEVERRFEKLTRSHLIFDVSEPTRPQVGTKFDSNKDYIASFPAVAG